MPVMVAVIVAVMGTAGLLLVDFGPDGGSQGRGTAKAITAAAVARAGAIEIASEPLT